MDQSKHVDWPAAFGDDHFGAQLVKLLPQVFPFEGDFGVVMNPIVLGLQGPERPKGVVVRHGEDHVLRGGVVRVHGSRGRQLGQQPPGVERREGGIEVGRGGRACQQRGHGEVCRPGQLQERVVGHGVVSRGAGAMGRAAVSLLESHRGLWNCTEECRSREGWGDSRPGEHDRWR